MDIRELEKYKQRLLLDRAVLKEAAREGSRRLREMLGNTELQISLVDKEINSLTKNPINED